jgi:type I restriction enzyme S subunit
MNAELLLKHFNRISEAPDAVARLRRFILDLAVRGKLVEQDPNDEPAAAALKRVSAITGLQAIIVGKEDNPLPFSLPTGWKWSRIGLITTKTGSGSTPRGGQTAYKSSGVPFLRSQNVYNDGLRLNEVVYIDQSTHARMCGTAVQPGDLLLNITGGSIGRCCRIPDAPIEANISQHVAIIRPAESGMRAFLHNLVLSPFFQSFVIGEQTGAGRGGLPKNRMDQIPIPVPPLAEQHRIVAKVDELMALCDRLEAAQNEREARRDRLVAASLHRMGTAPAAEGAAAQDVAQTATALRQAARFHLDHLPRLTTRTEHIKQLRQAILNLAVRGRLAPQDPNDVPVTELLDASDKVRHATAKEDRRADADQQTLLAVEECWAVPASWTWRALADLVLLIDYRGKTPTKVAQGVRLVTAKNVKKGFINLAPEEFLTEANYQEWMTRGLPKKGDILFTTEAPMGNAAVVRSPERFALAQRVICFRPYGYLDSDFMALQILAEPFQAILDKTATGLTAKGIKAAKLKRLPIAVPPIAEQHRIVAKVGELMALCDQLEAQLSTTQTDSRRLLEAVLHEALAA